MEGIGRVRRTRISITAGGWGTVLAAALVLGSAPSAGVPTDAGETAGGPTLSNVTARSSRDPYASDPLGLVAHFDLFQKYSLGEPTWHLWSCDLPHGDLSINLALTESLLNRTITPYFTWLSNGRYRPAFRSTGAVSGNDHNGCLQEISRQGSPLPLLMVDDSSWNGGGALSERVFVGGGAVSTVPGFSGPRLSVIAQEIGHSIGMPHSYGGSIFWSASGRGQGVFEYDNPMDIMDAPGISVRRGTPAINRYASGWIDSHTIVIHSGPAATYQLRGIGLSGLQMLVIPGNIQGVFHALDARLNSTRYDSDLPTSGVELYYIDQRESACHSPSSGACWGFERRTKPIPPARSPGYADNLTSVEIARFTDHVYGVGQTIRVGPVRVEVLGKVGDLGYRVRVVDNSWSGPDFTGRFSDDDGNVHETNIEYMAEVGVTVGCDEHRYCPDRAVTRVQMMVFLARAMGISSYPKPTESRFTDVPDGAWYLDSLEAMADRGVAKPSGDGSFRPDAALTRSDMAVFMTRLIPEISAVANPSGVFEDVPADARYAGAVEGLLAAGVTRGCHQKPFRYCPDRHVTRAQMASFLSRTLHMFGYHF